MYLGKDGKTSPSFSALQKRRVRNISTNKSHEIMRANFENTSYRTPLSHTVGMRKNLILNEWRKGDSMLREPRRTKRAPPGKSSLSRNAEINMFTGYVNGRPGRIPLREVDELRGLGVMVPGHRVATKKTRANPPFTGGERNSVQPLIQPITKPEDYKIARPWEHVSPRKAAREDFKRKQHKKFNPKRDFEWSKPETDRDIYQISQPYKTRAHRAPPKAELAPWKKPERVESSKRIFNEQLSNFVPPWQKGKMQAHNPRERDPCPWDMGYDADFEKSDGRFQKI